MLKMKRKHNFKHHLYPRLLVFSPDTSISSPITDLLVTILPQYGKKVTMKLVPNWPFRIPMGYVMHPSGVMDVLSDVCWDLHASGEDGNDPNDFTINFTAGQQQSDTFHEISQAKT